MPLSRFSKNVVLTLHKEQSCYRWRRDWAVAGAPSPSYRATQRSFSSYYSNEIHLCRLESRTWMSYFLWYKKCLPNYRWAVQCIVFTLYDGSYLRTCAKTNKYFFKKIKWYIKDFKKTVRTDYIGLIVKQFQRSLLDHAKNSVLTLRIKKEFKFLSRLTQKLSYPQIFGRTTCMEIFLPFSWRASFYEIVR